MPRTFLFTTKPDQPDRGVAVGGTIVASGTTDQIAWPAVEPNRTEQARPSDFPTSDGPRLTHVTLFWLKGEREDWLKFGTPIANRIVDRRQRIESYVAGQLFALVRWASNEYGTVSSAGLARPSRKTFMQALDAALDVGRKELGAAAVFDGNGGDSLFCFVHSSAPVLDCLAAAGLRPALTAFIDMCGVTGCDVVAMAGAVTVGGYPRADLAAIRPAVLALIDEARDLGLKGRDTRFGHGLICGDCGAR